MSVRSQPLFCRAAQLPPGPKLPRPGRPTLRKRSHNKEARVGRPPIPITQRQRRAPPGALGPCARAPTGSRESRSRTACSRENCALCAAEICTVISSAARVGRCAGLKLPPHRFDFYCSRRLLAARLNGTKTENGGN